mgnify:CR=1 FL=1
MKIKSILLGLCVITLLVSCEKEETTTPNINNQQILINSKMDRATDDVATIIFEQESNTNSNPVSGKATNSTNSFLPDCTTITRVPEFGTFIMPGTLVTKTIDFGTEGCPLANGNVLKGKLILSYEFLPLSPTNTITYTFEDFYHNDIKLDGSKTFTRGLMTSSLSNTIHPVSTMNLDLEVTFPDGTIYTRTGLRTRELIEGFETLFNYSDNVYAITENLSTTNPDGSVYTFTTESPLIYKLSCLNESSLLITSGIVTISSNGDIASLNYGDGTCDDLAVLTVNGNSTTIDFGF